MRRWKYTKEKPKFDFDEYLKMPLDKPTQVLVKRPEVIKKLIEGENRSVFNGTVIEVDGKKTEKLLVIKNYENVMLLKKKIAGKKEINLELTRRYDEDNMQHYYDINVLRKKTQK
jgi:hypothetical protein